MTEPKKIYFDHNLDGSMKTVLSGIKFSSADSVYHSDFHLKEWIEKNTIKFPIDEAETGFNDALEKLESYINEQ